MVEDEDLDPADAQRQSMALMDGHKGEYFVMILSFIPWMLLGAITLGIAYIWIIPYMSTTFAEYHVRLVEAAGSKKKIAKKAEEIAKENKKEYNKDKAEFDAAVEEVK